MRLRKTAFTIAITLVSGVCVALDSVVINEIHSDPTNKMEWVEFVELYNAGTNQADLSGWYFSKGLSYTFPANTLLATNAHLVVGQNPSQISNKFSVTSIMGPFIGTLNNEGETLELRNTLGETMDEVAYGLAFPWPTVGGNDYSMQLINPALDNSLGGSWRSAYPTPNAQNSAVYKAANLIPPLIRQVDHDPNQPASGEIVTITVKITDPEIVTNVTLLYQLVDPGNYINTNDAAYAANWTPVSMRDDGAGGDVWAQDGIYTVQMPGTLQTNRRLVRYRITAVDSNSNSVLVPYADDPQPNFAYFVYDGVPAWTGAAQPGTTTNMTFGTNVMRKLPVCHLISKNSDVEACTWPKNVSGYPTNVNFWADTNLWKGTLVYDGKVYDHIGYRPRGGIWRWAMGKNMWKFRFNRGHFVELEDDWGSNYDVKRDTLNFSACIQQGNFLHRGEHGMFEAVGFRLFELAGTPAPKTHWVHYRIIDDASETGATQYDGDFWGLYLSIEQVDGAFLDERDLPDGNVYKMEGVMDGPTWHAGELSHMGPTGPNDWTDLDFFRDSYMLNSNEGWWRSNVNVSAYYSFRAIVDGIHHYDIGAGKNYYYYRNPVVVTNQWGTNLLWTMLPWDLDLTWADNMWDCLNLGLSPFKQYGPFTNPATTVNIEFKNKIREIRDLLFNTDQAYSLIDQYAAVIHDHAGGPSFVDADMAQWDYNPTLTNMTRLDTSNTGGNPNTKAGHGRFYESAATRDFPGMVKLMKDYIVYRCAYTVDVMSADSNIPNTPTVTATTTNFYADKLTFQTSAFSDPNGDGTFASMKWRIGEITDTNSPTFAPAQSRKYEIESDWESAEMSNFTGTVTIPAGVARVGHTYRVRCKMKDSTGRWSHWSAPSEFTSGDTESSAVLAQNLRITELMYNPADGDSYEFIELYNSSPSVTLLLTGAIFTAGIDFTFSNGASISPNGYLLLSRNTNSSFSVFKQYYGLGAVSILGPYNGKLADAGEQITLKSASAGTVLFSFTYGGRDWPLAADGAGHSLVPLEMNVQTNGMLDYWGNWRASTYIKGSPCAADPTPLATNVVVNEIMAHSVYTNATPPYNQYDSDDWIELYNSAATNVTLANYWYLSDDSAHLNKWQIPGNIINATSWLTFDEITNFHNPFTNNFSLTKDGETLYLSYLAGSAQDRVVDCLKFDGQEHNISWGRYPDANAWWYACNPTRNTANQLLTTQDVVISEIMYHPKPTTANPDNNENDEYVELYNPRTTSVLLMGENGPWKLNGGVDYTFPPNTTIAPTSYLAVVSFEPTNTVAMNAFLTAYGLVNGQVRIFGPYGNKLDNQGESVRLERSQYPDNMGDAPAWFVVDEIIYSDISPWPTDADGTGRPLQRRPGRTSGNNPASWKAGLAATPGYAPAKVAITNPASGTSYLTPFSLDVEAGFDPDVVVGPVQRVEFYNGATLKSTDTTAPYGFMLSDVVSAGTYSLTARLVDSAGTSTSAVVQIMVYTNGPTSDAGKDQKLNILTYSSVTSSATLNYNGIPTQQVAVTWSYSGGPGIVTFGNASDIGTTATFSTPGTYVLCLRTVFEALVSNDYVTITVVNTNTLNQIPYEESFEDYVNGARIGGIDGWYVVNPDAAIVVTNNYAATYTNGFPLGGLHELALRVDGSVTNRFQNTASVTNVWMDSIVECRHWTDTLPPEPNAAAQFAVYINTNRHMVVWNCRTNPVVTNIWTELPNTNIGSNQFVRLTVQGSYSRDAAGYFKFRLWTDGVAITNPQTWFVTASTNRNYFSEILSEGLFHMDDLVVEDHDVLGWKTIWASVVGRGTISPSNSVLVALNGTTNFIMASNTWYHMGRVVVDGSNIGATTNYAFTNVTANHSITAVFDADLAASNTPKWWLVQWYATSNFDGAATGDSDHDGMYTWEEYIAGTHPTNPASVFEVFIVDSNRQVTVSYQAIAAGAEYDGKNRYYSLENMTNIQFGAWAGISGGTNILGTGQSVVYTNLSDPSRSIYYRGRVQLR